MNELDLIGKAIKKIQDKSNSIGASSLGFAWDEKGTERFTKSYPNKNLLYSELVSTNDKFSLESDNLSYRSSGAWANEFVGLSNLSKLLKPDTTYNITYDFELLSKKEGTTLYIQSAHGTLLLYNFVSKKSISLGGVENNISDAKKWKVGTKVTRTEAFKTPSSLENWQIIGYTMRSMNNDNTFSNLESGIFSKIKIEETNSNSSSVYTSNEKDDFYNAYPPFLGIFSEEINNYQWIKLLPYNHKSSIDLINRKLTKINDILSILEN